MNKLHKKAIIQLQKIPEINKMGVLSIDPTDKGLINYNFNVKTISGTIHARINRPDVLGINRQDEATVLAIIKPLNLSPDIIVNNQVENYLLTEYLDEPTWEKQDCYKHQQLLLNHLKKLHTIDVSNKLPSFLIRLKSYEEQSLDILDKGSRADYLKTKQALTDLRFFKVNRLLHFDLNASNLIGTKKLTIIDWEFAGCGHPIFDIAIFIHYNKLEILKCQKVVDYCHTFENGSEILKHSIKLAGYMIKLWEEKV